MRPVTLLWPFWVVLFGKLITLVGAMMQVVGLLALFGFDWLKAIEPWRWWLILGGTGLIAASEGGLHLFQLYLQRQVKREKT